MTDVCPQDRPEHPVVAHLRQRRAADLQLRVADTITALAGSMAFDWLHIVVLAAWMLVVETTAWPTPTLVVSLEAIFLTRLTREIHVAAQNCTGGSSGPRE